MSAVVRKSGGTDGWGFVAYEVEGTVAEIDSAIAELDVPYGNADYDFAMYWPPERTGRDGKPLTRNAPTDLGGGRWIAFGHRRASCD